MSYYLYPYMVDEKELGTLCGHSTQQRAEELLRLWMPGVRAWSSRLDGLGEPGGLDLAGAVRQWLTGSVPGQNSFQHAYALELICEQTGKLLPNSLFCGFRGDYLSAIDAALAGSGLGPELSLDRLSENGPPAWLVRDWVNLGIPAVGHIPAEQVSRFAEAARGVEVSADIGEVEDGAMEALSWIRAAAAQQKMLMLFCH